MISSIDKGWSAEEAAAEETAAEEGDAEESDGVPRVTLVELPLPKRWDTVLSMFILSYWSYLLRHHSVFHLVSLVL